MNASLLDASVFVPVSVSRFPLRVMTGKDEWLVQILEVKIGRHAAFGCSLSLPCMILMTCSVSSTVAIRSFST